MISVSISPIGVIETSSPIALFALVARLRIWATFRQGSNLTVGNTSNATQGRDLYRYTFTDNLTWQKGSHRIRFGTELETAPGTGFWGYCDPSCNVAASPELVRSLVPANLLPLFFQIFQPWSEPMLICLTCHFWVVSSASAIRHNHRLTILTRAKVNNRMRF